MIKYFTSEAVTEGHPDKVCDQISDAVLDDILKHDPKARVACETVCTAGLIMVMGEITSAYNPDIQEIARETVRNIGYTGHDMGFDSDTCAVITSVNKQSEDIALGTNDETGGAGDQGMMFGYASDETPELMPLPISLANGLCRRLSEVRKDGTLFYLRPDGKSQVTIEYHDGKPFKVKAVVVSAQHDETVSLSKIREDITENVIKKVIPGYLLHDDTEIYVNPTGRFVKGGPAADTGLTGRKIICDTYGGMARHGGGAFSGKDPTKVDRSAAYALRWAAKNIVAAGLAEKCELSCAYAIGVAKPLSFTVNTFGTGKYPDDVIADATLKVFDFTPAGIIKSLDLRKPIYSKLAAYGAMGREDADAPWEECSMTEELLSAI